MTDRTRSDIAIRELLEPLRQAQPPAPAYAAVRQAHTAMTGTTSWRTPRRFAVGGAAVAAIAAAVTVAGLALPGGPRGERSGDRPASAFAILTAAAASAAERPPAASAYSYGKTLLQAVYGHRTPYGDASFTTEQTSERWIDADGRGVQRSSRLRLTASSGTPQAQDWRSRGTVGGGSVTGAKADVSRPRTDGFGNPDTDLRRLPAGDGEIARMSPRDLPTDPDRLERRLSATGDARPGRDENDADARANLIAAEIALLADGRTPPAVRSAVFTVLARTPGARADGPGPDAVGRSGERISIVLPAARHLGPETYRLIVDPRTSQLLEWSRERALFDAVGASAAAADFDLGEPSTLRTVLLDQRAVETAPALPPQPAHCTDGVTPGVPRSGDGRAILVAPGSFWTTAEGRRQLAKRRARGAEVVRITEAQEALIVADRKGCRPGG